MNHAEAIKHITLPDRRGVTGSNLGPKLKFTLTEQGQNESKILAGSTSQGAGPQTVTLRTSPEAIRIVCADAKGLAAAGILAEHMRDQLGGGPVTTAKDAGVFSVGFALHQPPKAEPVQSAKPTKDKHQAEQA